MELLDDLLFQLSSRKDNPFVPISPDFREGDAEQIREGVQTKNMLSGMFFVYQ
jgi:hypothetical protein